MSSRFRNLKYAIKDANDEKLNIYERVSMYFDSVFRYAWGIRHIKSLYHNIRCLIVRYDLIRTNLGRASYHHKPELMLHGVMNLVVEFVDTDRGFDLVDFGTSGSAWSKAGVDIMVVYEWWKDRPEREREITVALDNWYNHSGATGDGTFLTTQTVKKPTSKSIQAQRFFDIHTYLEGKLRDEDNEMLTKAITIREFLWT